LLNGENLIFDVFILNKHIVLLILLFLFSWRYINGVKIVITRHVNVKIGEITLSETIRGILTWLRQLKALSSRIKPSSH